MYQPLSSVISDDYTLVITKLTVSLFLSSVKQHWLCSYKQIILYQEITSTVSWTAPVSSGPQRPLPLTSELHVPSLSAQHVLSLLFVNRTLMPSGQCPPLPPSRGSPHSVLRSLPCRSITRRNETEVGSCSIFPRPHHEQPIIVDIKSKYIRPGASQLLS